jgi:hypothetical protein
MPRLSAADACGELVLTVAPTIRPDDPGTVAETISGTFWTLFPV